MSHSRWTIIDSGVANALENMTRDAKFLEELDATSSTPILHLYDWEAPSATYGHFIDPTAHLSQEAFVGNHLQLAKRPTGGGLIFHVADWAFSLLVPAGHETYSVNTLENYAFVNRLVIRVISRLIGRTGELGLNLETAVQPKPKDDHSRHFCMAKPTKYDVMLDGKKVAGGAQRRTKSGFLHQGTISLAMPDPLFLEKVLSPGTCVWQAMVENTCALLDGKPGPGELQEARKSIQNCFLVETREYP